MFRQKPVVKSLPLWTCGSNLLCGAFFFFVCSAWVSVYLIMHYRPTQSISYKKGENTDKTFYLHKIKLKFCHLMLKPISKVKDKKGSARCSFTQYSILLGWGSAATRCVIITTSQLYLKRGISSSTSLHSHQPQDHLILAPKKIIFTDYLKDFWFLAPFLSLLLNCLFSRIWSMILRLKVSKRSCMEKQENQFIAGTNFSQRDTFRDNPDLCSRHKTATTKVRMKIVPNIWVNKFIYDVHELHNIFIIYVTAGTFIQNH